MKIIIVVVIITSTKAVAVKINRSLPCSPPSCCWLLGHVDVTVHGLIHVILS